MAVSGPLGMSGYSCSASCDPRCSWGLGKPGTGMFAPAPLLWVPSPRAETPSDKGQGLLSGLSR